MPTHVPFVNLTRAHRSLGEAFERALRETINHGDFVGGESVTAFERSFARKHGHSEGISCGSGTDALILGLRSLEIGPGDEVLVPAMTFAATAEAVVHSGATPIFVDVEPETLLISEEAARRARTPRTRAVMPVHLYGHPVAFDTIKRWRESGLKVIEDAAQAHLASWQGQPVGTAGDATAFSFYPAKNLGALGDAGLLLLKDQSARERARLLRDHGSAAKYDHQFVGYSSRLDSVQARFLLIKLDALEQWTHRRRLAAQRYQEKLDHVEGISLVTWNVGSAHHLCVVRVSPKHRHHIGRELSRAGVGWGIHYPTPVNELAAFRRSRQPCPVASQAGKEVLSLPMDGTISNDEVDYVCRSLELILDSMSE